MQLNHFFLFPYCIFSLIAVYCFYPVPLWDTLRFKPETGAIPVRARHRDYRESFPSGSSRRIGYATGKPGRYGKEVSAGIPAGYDTDAASACELFTVSLFSNYFYKGELTK